MQTAHVVLPATGAKLPRSHNAHTLEAAVAVALPGLQSEHAALPAAAANMPAAHGAHAGAAAALW